MDSTWTGYATGGTSLEASCGRTLLFLFICFVILQNATLLSCSIDVSLTRHYLLCFRTAQSVSTHSFHGHLVTLSWKQVGEECAGNITTDIYTAGSSFSQTLESKYNQRLILFIVCYFLKNTRLVTFHCDHNEEQYCNMYLLFQDRSNKLLVYLK